MVENRPKLQYDIHIRARARNTERPGSMAVGLL